MAGRISGITIEIGGDTSNLQRSLRDVDGQLRQTQSALKDVNKLLKLDPGNTELLTQKQKDLERAIGTTKTRLDELKKAQAGVSEGTDEWDALQREIIATEQNLQGLEQEYRNFGSVGAQQVAAVGKKMQEVGSSIEGLGQKLAPVSAAAAGLIGSFVGLGYSALTSADDLNTLAKQTGLSTDEIQKMQYAADLVDVSFSDIEGALKKMKSKMDPANESFQQLGVAVTDADGNMRSATDVFYDSIAALSQIENETERDQMAMELFGKSADSLAGIIDDGGAALKAYGEQAEQMGLIMGQDTVDNLNKVNDTIDTLKAQGGAALAQLGATVATVLGPSLEKIVGIVSKVTEAIAKLTPAQAETILKILAVTASIAPLLKTGGKLISGIGKAMKLAPKIKTAISLVTGALSPTTLIIAAVVAAVAALAVIIYKNWDKIKAWTKEMVDKVKGFFENMKKSITDTVNKVKDAVSKAWNAIKTTVTNVADGVKKTAVTAWDNVKSATTKAFNAVKSTVSEKMAATKKAFEDNGGGIKGAAAATVEAVKGYYTVGFDALNKLTGGKLDTLKKSISDAWDNIKSTANTKIDAIKTAVVAKWETVKTGVTTTVTNIKTSISSTWDSIKTTASSKIDAIKTTVSTAFTGVVNKIKEIMKFDFKLPSLTLPTWESMKAHFDGLVTSLKNAFKFTWSLPNIKLPHFKVTGGKWPYGLGGEGYLPSISIDWYKRAYQNPIMFTSPTVMATPQGYKGFGDAGAEIVLGLNKLQELVGGARPVVVNVYGAPGQSVDALADAVTQRITNLQMQRNAVYA